jgi:hypothetical protein
VGGDRFDGRPTDTTGGPLDDPQGCVRHRRNLSRVVFLRAG